MSLLKDINPATTSSPRLAARAPSKREQMVTVSDGLLASLVSPRPGRRLFSADRRDRAPQRLARLQGNGA